MSTRNHFQNYSKSLHEVEVNPCDRYGCLEINEIASTGIAITAVVN